LVRHVAVAAILDSFSSVVMLAQTHRASIRGIVEDGAGPRMSAVEIGVMDERTRESRSVKTDHEGRFTIVEMPPGVYRLTIDHAGYGRFIARAELAMNQDYWLNVRLQQGDMIQAVDIVGPFFPSDHDIPAVHMLLTERDLNEWPIESGNVLELARLAPGTASAVQGSRAAQAGRFAMHVNGAREDFTNYLLDGVSNLDPAWNTPVVRSTFDSIREFQVFTSNFDASFGRTAGAQISAVTKSGTNTLAGSFYGFGRGTWLGGRNHFAPKEGPAPEYTRAQAGGTIGGPVVENRTFFFADYERTRLREAVMRPASPTFLPPPGSAVSLVRHDDVHIGDVRLDQVLGDGRHLTGRYSLTDRNVFEPFPAGGVRPLLLFPATVPQRGQNVALLMTHVPSSAFVNDVRVAYNRASFRTNALLGYAPPALFDLSTDRRTETLQIADTVTTSHGHHTVKAGGEWVAGRLRISPAPAREVDQLRTSSAALFLQNDWRPVSTLSVTAGVRYEYATPPTDPENRAPLYDVATGTLVRVGSGGTPRGGFVGDRNNIGPRLGFAWTVGPDRMNVIRGGYGVSYNQTPLATSALLFPTGIFSPSAIGYQRDLQTPRLDAWTLNFQHQLGQSRSFEFAYDGSRGRHLLAARDINQPAATPALRNPRPNPLFSDITLLESRAASTYNAFHVRYQQRPATGTSIFAQYTLGRATDDASGVFPTAGDPNFPQNSLDLRSERARSSFDIRHRFAGAITRPLPFNKGQFLGNLGFLSRALADSDLEAVATFESGRPFTVLLADVDNSNTGSSRFVGANDRPNVNGNPALPRGSESAWFNTNAFSMPPFGTFGSSGRNALTGPGYKRVDAAFVRHIRFGAADRASVDLRVEAFNLLSTVNYDLPDLYYGSPTFGRLLSAGSPRRVQFGVRASF
jgi:hypothetical protein